MAEPIEIVIRKTQETSTQKQDGVKKPKSDTSITQKAVNTALINAGKQIAMYGLSQYGNLTGNTITQRNIDTALSIVGYVGQIAVGGWVGAIAVGAQLGMGAINSNIEILRANQQAELLYERSGNATINGGRGTND